MIKKITFIALTAISLVGANTNAANNNPATVDYVQLYVQSQIAKILSSGIQGPAGPTGPIGPIGPIGPVGPGGVSGTGTANTIPLWTNTTILGNSSLTQNVSDISSGGALSATTFLNSGSSILQFAGTPILTIPTDTTNLALGIGALPVSPANGSNTAIGNDALGSNQTGRFNAAIGQAALSNNMSGESNTALGLEALLLNISGNGNTAIGQSALVSNSTGQDNIAIGFFSGSAAPPANNNSIYIGAFGSGSDASGTIYIGTYGAQTSFFVTGVSGVTTGVNDAVPVVIDSNGQFGTISSSRRFKEDIQDMAKASQNIMRLRPVTFRYIKPYNDGSKPIQYGLIAEEVAEVYPDLVVYSADGQIQSVKYQVLDVLLLNELQHQQSEIKSLKKRLAKMEAVLSSLSGTLK
ncbi:MAG: tail fiber domain-containing protein [Legionellales bacterium]